jgi:hypothetical protein
LLWGFLLGRHDLALADRKKARALGCTEQAQDKKTAAGGAP